MLHTYIPLFFLILGALVGGLGGFCLVIFPANSSTAVGGLVLVCTSLLIFAMYAFTHI